jgi:multidrug efflux pump subunit AcrB
VRAHVKTGPESISHINQITSVTIFYNLKPGYPTGTATDALQQAAKEIIPPSVAGAPAGSSAQFIETVKAMIVLIAIFVMYMILGILYESYIHPITAAIFGALPMAMGFGADGSSRQPMGLCIVGGLIVAQILTLFCTPVFYIYIEYYLSW